MYRNKHVLLIAGGGTLGTYTAKELLRLGAWVDVLCPEEKVSDHERLAYIRAYATEEVLAELFSTRRYDGIVNFLHYEDVEEYQHVYPLLIANTDQLVFLSSYRVYGDEQHPITETAPRLHEVIGDESLRAMDTYGVRKGLCEDFLRTEHAGDRWTVVRPVISFSERRLDIVMDSKHRVLDRADSGEPLRLPASVKELRAGIDWAGNSGKLIANLLFREGAIGEAFTVYSGHGMTWGEVADAYASETGVRIEWVSDEAYLDVHPKIREVGTNAYFMWHYDRSHDRDIDSTKILSVTGLTRDDFGSVAEGIRAELDRLGWKKK